MKVALIEIGGSHDECLYTQVKFLSTLKDIHLTLICDNSLKENINYFDSVDEKIVVEVRKGVKQWVDVYRIWKICKTQKFDKIIFNTAQGITIGRLLSFPFPIECKLYGVLHDTSKLFTSRTQKGISKKIKHYFLLNEYLEKQIDVAKRKELTFSVFHPIFFPNYPRAPIVKKEDELWICVPGQVELKRRDYESLFASIRANGISDKVKFLFLGRHGHFHGDGDYVLGQIKDLKLEGKFLLWESFIPVAVFHSMLLHSDYILPLIHPGNSSGTLYDNQITGAFNLAVAYKKKVLIEERLVEKLSDYEPISYSIKTMMKTINELEKRSTSDLYLNEKWSFEFQKSEYLKALGC